MIAAILFAWLQYGSDGLPHARAVVTGACPTAFVDGRPLRMEQRTGEAPGFADDVCDAPVPVRALRVRVADRVLPAPVRSIKTVVVFGDTGCRVLGTALQACNDPVKWPFPVVARSVAKVHPDLVVHVGDYYYRETPCPPFFTGCAGTPSGDNAASWYADWLDPGRPLFASVPLVLARGNHEDCRRGGHGWTRYLDAYPFAACPAISAPYAVRLPGLTIVVFDSAVANDDKVDPALPFKANFDAARALVHGPENWFLTHRPPYLNADEAADMGPDLDAFSAVIVGHVHLFAVMNEPPHAPLVINGIGGDTLDDAQGARLRTALGPDGASVSVHFGFAVYTRTPTGWAISLRDPDGNERGRCVLRDGKPGAVRCPGVTPG